MSFELPHFLISAPRNPAIAVGLPLALGFASGFITKSSVTTWFDPLKKPAGQPPSIAFPIVWSGLYAGIGLASHLLSNALEAELPGTGRAAAAKLALKLYWVQLGLNLAWTPLFFGGGKVLAALGDILILTPVTYTLTYQAYQVDPRTAFAFVPYSLWLTYATYLNGGVYYLNFLPKSWQLGAKKSGESKDL